MKLNVLGAKLVLVIFFILFLSRIALAGVPVPWGAKLMSNDIAITEGGEERKITSYETNTSKQELLNYYLKEMPNRGYSLFMNGEQNLIFKKGEELVFIILPPSQNSKTNFMVSVASLPELGENNPYDGVIKCESIPSVPVYPGASCLQSTRLKSGKSMSAAYSTNDSGDTVINFYRAQMPQSNWRLKKELSNEDVMSALQSQEQVKKTPEQEAALRNFYGGTQGLFFTNHKGDNCSVHVMNHPLAKGSYLINLVYEEKTAQQ